MYSEDDLDNAIKNNVLSEVDVTNFRQFIATQRNTNIADEEFVKFVSGFNDIFVVIACVLALVSSTYILMDIHMVLGGLALMIMSWLFAEYFTVKRKLALPSIVLVFAFVIGSALFAGGLLSGEFIDNNKLASILIIGGFSTCMAFVHWKRFAVPITFATILATFCYSLVLGLKVAENQYNFGNLASIVALFLGIAVMLVALKWDMADKQRMTRKADVAFWLHLVSAPMIVHAVFSLLNIMEANPSSLVAISVLFIFIGLSIVSLSIDRRALMVSSLFYVLYVFTQLFDKNGISDSFAITAMLLGFGLVVLSALWHPIRRVLVSMYPNSLQNKLPNT